MSARTNRLAISAALLAACSLVATPAQARDRYGRWDRDRVDVGDIIGGVVVLGTVAAIASAASRNSRDRYGVPYPGHRRGDRRYEYERTGGGLDRAADMCVAEAEHGSDRVASVDNVARNRDGWAVFGQLESGAGFSCRIGNDGRIIGVATSGYEDAQVLDDGTDYQVQGPVVDRQWDDETYARLRGVAAADDVPPLPEPAGEGGWDSPGYDQGG